MTATLGSTGRGLFTLLFFLSVTQSRDTGGDRVCWSHGHGASDRVMSATKVLKLVIYTILFLCVAYWAYAGDFLDFYDAALWLFAFIFIELNVFEWQYETVSEHPVAA